jgi:Tol biopolymer transport system component
MNSDGTGLTRITNEGESADPTFPFFPVFSPDEQEILIKVDQEGNDEIYAVNSDGTDRVNVTNNDSAHDSQPTFSPDGKKMAFVSQRYDDSGKFVSEIYLMDLDR